MRFALALCLAGCAFSPALDGVFRCGGDGDCPSGLQCSNDHVCRVADPYDAAPVASGPGPGDLMSPPDLAKRPQDDGEQDMSVPSDLDGLSTVDLATCIPLVCSDGMCGDLLDGCGSKITCGMCMGKDMACGGGGPNLCGKGDCHPVSCGALNAKCGFVSDSCAHVLDCGHCPATQTCDPHHQCI